MGLSSKQVSVDVLDWSQSLLQSRSLMELPKPPQQQQQQQQSTPPLRCPRCDSTNTKFCYYNNYNKSQPRHFCKTCKRHWTKGGTLRNVPVGGGRKNKRLKTSNSSSSSAATTTNTPNLRAKNSNDNNLGIQSLQQNLSLPFSEQKSISEILYQALLPPTSSQQLPDFNIDVNVSSSSGFLGSTLSLPLLPNFPFNFDNNPSALISSSFTGAFSSPNVYSHPIKMGTAEDPISTTTSSADTTIATTVSTAMPWQVPPTTSGSLMDSSQFWNWDDDFTAIVTNDLGQPWDDPDGDDSSTKQL